MTRFNNITPGMAVAFDFESYYSKAEKYSLKVMSPYDYVRDPRFDAYLVSFRAASGESYVGSPLDFDWTCLEGAHLIAHNATFDGMVLNRLFEQGKIPRFNYLLDCTADMCAFLNAGRSLADAAKNLLGLTLSKQVRSDMDGKKLCHLTPDELTALLEYGGSDSDVCYALWEAFSDKWPEWEREFSRENRNACWRGVRIDVEGTRLGLAIIKAKNAEAESKLPWVKEGKAAGSTPQLKKHAVSLGMPVPKSFNKQMPEMQEWTATYAKDHDFIQARLDFSSTNPHIARLESMLEIADHDGIVRFDSIYYGAHCLTGDHEVLTKDGWVALSVWPGGDIMQWEEGTREMELRPAGRHSFLNTEPCMVEVNAPFIKTTMTLGHTVPVVKTKKNLHKMKAEDLLSRVTHSSVPISGTYTGTGVITPEQMRVLVATQADGSYAKSDGILIFTLRKPRKIARIQELLAAAGLPYTLQYFPSAPTQARVSVARRFLPSWLSKDRKTFGPWLLDSTPEARQAFVDEYFRWDGWSTNLVTKKNNVPYSIKEYYSGVRENVRWVATMLHITGLSAGKIGMRPAKGNSKPGYRTVQKEVWLTDIYPNKGHVSSVPPEPVVYCPSTETGWFLCRHKDTIFVTGNTGRCSGRVSEKGNGGARMNFFNMPKGGKDGLVHGVDIRGLIIPRPKHKFIIYDYSNIEPRVSHWLAGNTEFLSMVATENLYQASAKALGWFPKDEDGLKQKNKQLYALAKATNIGMTYMLGAAKFMATCDKIGAALDLVPVHEWNLDRTKKFVLLNVAKIDYRDPANAETVSKFLAADKIVKQWRAANPRLTDPKTGLWAKLMAEMETAAKNGEKVHYFRLPSGRRKPFFNPHFRIETVMNIDPDNPAGPKKPTMRKQLFAQVQMGGDFESIHGGSVLERLVQAIARDIMVWGAMDCVKHDSEFHYIGNVYDEVISEVPDEKAEYANGIIPNLLCRGSASAWTKGLPLEVDMTEGGIKEKYEK